MNKMSYDEIKAAGAKLLAMPRPGEFERSERVIFLEETFSGRTDNFCQFMGHMKGVLETRKISKADAVSIFDDIAMAALHIGRDDGRYDAIKRYAAPAFKFLLNDREATA